VLAAVEFDDDGTLEADEVQDEVSKRMLSAKFASFELTTSEHSPKRALGIRWRIAQSAL